MGLEKRRLPGGALQGRAAQGQDNKWRDQFGEVLDFNKAQDMDYAARFWARSQPTGMRENMMTIVESSANQNPPQLASFIDPSGITEKDKEKLSAYRVLAEEMGYEVGPYVLNNRSYTALAPIHKKL